MSNQIKMKLGCIIESIQRKKMSFSFFRKIEKCSYGNENDDKVFYVIRRSHYGGLFSDVQMFIGHLIYAQKKGWIPIIDRKNYGNKWYHEESEVGKVNAWEFYFEQPGGYGLYDIRNSSNIVLSNENDVLPWDRYDFASEKIYYDLEHIKKINYIYSKYIRLNVETKKYVQNELSNTFQGRKRILGVICRYGYNLLWKEQKLTIHNHPRQPELNMLINKANICMKEWGDEWIYLATDNSKVVDCFREHFGERLLVNGGKTFAENGLGGLSDSGEVKRKRGLEYIANIYILAQCNDFLGGMNGGAATAMVINGGNYEHKYIFELGNYVIPDFKGFEDEH